MTGIDDNKRFYLGRIFDVDTTKTTEQPLLYASADLTTHGLVVGMTGSGKTGLCLTLLEEAGLDNIPAIMIDPKGDIANLLLQFPDFAPADYLPWVNADAAQREGKTVEQAATEASEQWRTGLAGWGLTGEHIRQLKERVQMTIYTPGSTSGRPISILASLKHPQLNWEDNLEVLLEQIQSTVTALLGLIGYTNLDPVTAREHILLANIIQNAWAQGHDLDLGELILQVQTPPFQKLGFFTVDQLFPPKDRLQLAMQLNNILASPAFQSWLTGDALDVQSLLYTESGKARHTIFYIAHLNDAERMFIVTLLFSAIESWMRSQSGTTNLRALVYFDEIFGYLPPSANPPSKKPILRMLKQARAFGVGLLLATQNPVDIDYKALSNAGTWLIGRLQTERDKMRLLDGLEGAAGGTFNRQQADQTLSKLNKRVFIINNVNSKTGLQVFQTRWALSYLAGPLTRSQLKALNELAGNHFSNGATTATAKNVAATQAIKTPGLQAKAAAGERVADTPAVETAASATSNALDGYTRTQPAVPSLAENYFYRRELDVNQALQNARKTSGKALALVYLPSLLAQADVRFIDRANAVDIVQQPTVLLPSIATRPQWEAHAITAMDPKTLGSVAENGAYYSALPAAMADEKRLKTLQVDFIDYLYRNSALSLAQNTSLKLVAQPGESEIAFATRCDQTADQLADAEAEKLKAKYADKLARLQQKISKEQREVAESEAEVKARQMEEMTKHGETIFKLASSFLGGGRRQASFTSNLEKRRQTSNAKADLEQNRAELETLNRELRQLQDEFAAELQTLSAKWDEVARQINNVKITPYKKDIALTLFGVVWLPYWLVETNGNTEALPAYAA
jgi:hypothetical protein